jgi:hypothetical protein
VKNDPMSRLGRKRDGMRIALDALEAERRPATDDDAPRRVSTFPGKKVKPLPGQLSLDDELAEVGEG